MGLDQSTVPQLLALADPSDRVNMESPMEKRCCSFGGRTGGVASIESKSSVERKWCSGERTVALVDRGRSPSAWVMQ